MACAMVLNASNKGHNHAPNQLIRSFERILEDAQISGELNLSGKKLKEFPKVRKEYNLSDTVNADLSKNRFCEVPPEIPYYYSLERLDLYYNVLRSLPENISNLQSLVYLDLSRNQLQWLPPGICQLMELQVLLIGNNRLSRLPPDLGNLASLAELDVSANQLTQLPPSIGKLSKLRSLVARSNQLKSLPVELSALRLERLDISSNQITALPTELRVMTSLVELELGQNPLSSPPSSLCVRGKVHIFKYLEILAQKGDSRKPLRSDTLDGRGKRRQTLPGRVSSRSPEGDMFYTTSSRTSPIPVSAANTTLLAATLSSLGMTNGNSSGHSTPSTISPGSGDTLDDVMQQQQQQQQQVHYMQSKIPVVTEAAKRPDRLAGLVHSTDNSSTPSDSPPSPSHEQDDKKGPVEHIQTYREYKEALKLQRWQPQDIYRRGSPHELGATPTTPSEKQNDMQYQRSNDTKTVTFGEKKRDPKMEAVISYVKSQMPNGHSPTKNGGTKSTNGDISVNNNSPKRSSLKNGKEVGKLSPSRTLSFTMRREHEKAKEEAHLIAQLKQSLETRLKMSLPVSELAAALQDGVVLCHLANHVRPRSVASVHVPSAAVPKLTMARCRKNVDNFLEACRKIGVSEESVSEVYESFNQYFQSEYELGGVLLEKHSSNLVTLILELLNIRPKPPCTDHISSILFILTFLATLFILYLMPDTE